MRLPLPSSGAGVHIDPCAVSPRSVPTHQGADQHQIIEPQSYWGKIIYSGRGQAEPCLCFAYLLIKYIIFLFLIFVMTKVV